MKDETKLWQQPKRCDAGVPEGSYRVKGRLTCWEHCCKAYCGDCAFFKDKVETIDAVERDWDTPEEDKAWKYL